MAINIDLPFGPLDAENVEMHIRDLASTHRATEVRQVAERLAALTRRCYEVVPPALDAAQRANNLAEFAREEHQLMVRH